MLNIVFKSSIERDLKNIDRHNAVQLINKIQTNLSNLSLECKPLKGRFKGLRKYRIGNYRIIFTIIENEIIITKIGHKKDVYK